MKQNDAEFKARLIEQLKTETLKVTFLKQDGSVRTMNCTTNPKMTPTPVVPRRNPDVVTVFDTDINDWRSFRIDRVKSVDRANTEMAY